MMKYIIAILVFITALAAMLLYVGDDITLSVSSSAQTGLLAFAPRQMTWQIMILFAVTALVLFTAIGSVIGWIWRLPRRIKSASGLRRQNQALGAIEDALLFAAKGDLERSRKKAERARALSRSHNLGRIISAITAENCADETEALRQYNDMLDTDKTRAIGQRGLAQYYIKMGDYTAAIEHAQNAYAENKHARWAFGHLFQAQIADYQWVPALDSLSLALSRKHIDKDQAQRLRAVLQSAEATQLHKDGDLEAALALASKAAQLAPEFTPAAILAAKLYIELGTPKKAAGLIEKSWKAMPHPVLGLAYMSIFETDNAKTRRKKLDALIKHNSYNRESDLLIVQEVLRQGDAAKALLVLGPYISETATQGVTARLCLLAARAHELSGDVAAMKIWLQRALQVPYEMDWTEHKATEHYFDYGPQDWHGLALSYGQDGKLTFPHHDYEYKPEGLMAEPVTGLVKGAVIDPVTKASDNDGAALPNSEPEPDLDQVPEAINAHGAGILTQAIDKITAAGGPNSDAAEDYDLEDKAVEDDGLEKISAILTDMSGDETFNDPENAHNIGADEAASSEAKGENNITQGLKAEDSTDAQNSVKGGRFRGRWRNNDSASESNSDKDIAKRLDSLLDS